MQKTKVRVQNDRKVSLRYICPASAQLHSEDVFFCRRFCENSAQKMRQGNKTRLDSFTENSNHSQTSTRLHPSKSFLYKCHTHDYFLSVSAVSPPGWSHRQWSGCAAGRCSDSLWCLHDERSGKHHQWRVLVCGYTLLGEGIQTGSCEGYSLWWRLVQSSAALPPPVWSTDGGRHPENRREETEMYYLSFERGSVE